MPAPPISASAPAPPISKSLPSPPSSRSLPAPPAIVLSRPLPMPMKVPTPLKRRISTLAASVRGGEAGPDRVDAGARLLDHLVAGLLTK